MTGRGVRETESPLKCTPLGRSVPFPFLPDAFLPSKESKRTNLLDAYCTRSAGRAVFRIPYPTVLSLSLSFPSVRVRPLGADLLRVLFKQGGRR